jgi:hypothetical protein
VCPTANSPPVTRLMKLDFPAPVCPITAIKTSFSTNVLTELSSEELSDEESRSSDPSSEALKVATGAVLVAGGSDLAADGSDLAVGGSDLVVADTVLLVAGAALVAAGNVLVVTVEVVDVEGAVLGIAGALLVAAVAVLVIAGAVPVFGFEGFEASGGAFEGAVASSFAPPAASEGKTWACGLESSLDVIVSLPQRTDEIRCE